MIKYISNSANINKVVTCIDINVLDNTITLNTELFGDNVSGVTSLFYKVQKIVNGSVLDTIYVGSATSPDDVAPFGTDITKTMLPYIGGNFSYGDYRVTVTIVDPSLPNNTNVQIVYNINVCSPTGEVSGQKILGDLGYKVDCKSKKLIVFDETQYTYKGKSPYSTTREITVKNLDGQLANTGTTSPSMWNITNNGLHEVTINSLAKYEIDDCVFVSIPYLEKGNVEVRCDITLCHIQCAIDRAYSELSSCTESERKSAGEKMLEVLSLVTSIQNKQSCGLDFGKEMTRLEEILGEDCMCKCNNTDDIQSPPTLNDIDIVEGCNIKVIKSQSGSQLIYTIGSIAHVVSIAEGSQDYLEVTPVEVDDCYKMYDLSLNVPILASEIMNSIITDEIRICELSALVYDCLVNDNFFVVKVSETDTCEGYLIDKIVGGDGINVDKIVEENVDPCEPSCEKLEISIDKEEICEIIKECNFCEPIFPNDRDLNIPMAYYGEYFEHYFEFSGTTPLVVNDMVLPDGLKYQVLGDVIKVYGYFENSPNSNNPLTQNISFSVTNECTEDPFQYSKEFILMNKCDILIGGEVGSNELTGVEGEFINYGLALFSGGIPIIIEIESLPPHLNLIVQQASSSDYVILLYGTLHNTGLHALDGVPRTYDIRFKVTNNCLNQQFDIEKTFIINPN